MSDDRPPGGDERGPGGGGGGRRPGGDERGPGGDGEVLDAGLDQAGGGGGRRRDPRFAAASLAVTAGLAAIVTGFVIVALVTGGPGGELNAEWYIAVASTTLVVFGPFALLAALGGRGLLRRRQWAPLLLLLGGTMVAGAGLAIVALTASYATMPHAGGDVPLDWVFEQVDDETLWILVAFAALLAVIGTLEAAAGVMGRGAAAQPPRRAPSRAR